MSTTRVSTLIVSTLTLEGAEGCCACAAAIPNVKALSSSTNHFVEPIHRWFVIISLLSRNLHRSVFCGHKLLLSIPGHHPNQISSGLYVKARSQGDARSQLALQRLAFPTHLQQFFIRLKEVSVAIEHGSHHGQVILIAIVGLLV